MQWYLINKLLHNNFNDEYFTNLGPTLANGIATPIHKSFHDYLTAPSTANRSFDHVSETNIAKIIDNFPPKN